MKQLSAEALKAWEEDLIRRHPKLAGQISRLENGEHGTCDRVELMTLLHRVSRSRTEEWKQCPKSKVRKITESLGDALSDLEFLTETELRREVLPKAGDYDFESICDGLKQVRDKLEAITPAVEKRYKPRTNSAIAGVVQYVLEQHRPAACDSEVGKLVGAVLGKQKMNMKRWRQRHPDLLKPNKKTKPIRK